MKFIFYKVVLILSFLITNVQIVYGETDIAIYSLQNLLIATTDDTTKTNLLLELSTTLSAANLLSGEDFASGFRLID